jgi:hypothetical protein
MRKNARVCKDEWNDKGEKCFAHRGGDLDWWGEELEGCKKH